MTNPNILSLRYATPEINQIFSQEGKIQLERELWVQVVKAQKELGLDISQEDIDKLERAKSDINLEQIQEIETRTRHDIKAKIESYIQTSGASEIIHMALTSRDLTDNVELIQNKLAGEIILNKYTNILREFINKAKEYSNIVICARTHHQPAQPTTLGNRFANYAQELFHHLKAYEQTLIQLPFRGIKGPVGTQVDMTNLLGSKEKTKELEQKVANHFGFTKILTSTGQVYPRSIDFQLIANLNALAMPLDHLATDIRLMAGFDLVTEGFKKGQVGSSAMPHKRNTRSSERDCGFAILLKQYLMGAAMNTMMPFEEGDVRCSAPRRVILPDAFYTSDGICETSLRVLNEMGIYEKKIEQELNHYLPFLASTSFLMHAVKLGIGREEAHEIIKEYAVKEALEQMQGKTTNDLIQKLSEDETFKQYNITKEALQAILDNKDAFLGRAKDQITELTSEITPYLKTRDNGYQGKDIL